MRFLYPFIAFIPSVDSPLHRCELLLLPRFHKCCDDADDDDDGRRDGGRIVNSCQRRHRYRAATGHYWIHMPRGTSYIEHGRNMWPTIMALLMWGCIGRVRQGRSADTVKKDKSNLHIVNLSMRATPLGAGFRLLQTYRCA